MGVTSLKCYQATRVQQVLSGVGCTTPGKAYHHSYWSGRTKQEREQIQSSKVSISSQEQLHGTGLSLLTHFGRISIEGPVWALVLLASSEFTTGIFTDVWGE